MHYNNLIITKSFIQTCMGLLESHLQSHLGSTFTDNHAKPNSFTERGEGEALEVAGTTAAQSHKL